MLASIFYYNRKYALFYICLFSIVSEFLGVLAAATIKSYDYLFVLTFVCSFIGKLRNSAFFSVKRDIVGKFILIIVGLTTFDALMSPVRGVESLPYALMVLRFEIPYLLYFVFRSIPVYSLKKSMPILLYGSIITGILYYLQFIGIFLLVASDESQASMEFSRYNNIPILTIPIILYLFSSTGKTKNKMSILVFFAGILILSQNRGMILAVAIALGYYIIKYRTLISKKMIVGLGIVVLLSSSVLAYRFSQKGSTGDGLKSELLLAKEMFHNRNYRFYDNSMMVVNGTLAFRSALIAERVDYLVEHPLSLIIGAGSYHEKSPSTKKLPFVLGSRTEDGVAKVDTGDISLVSRIFRYGLLYMFIFAAFLYRVFRNALVGKSHINRLCQLLLVTYFFMMTSADVFFYPPMMLVFLILVTYSNFKNAEND